MAIATPSSPPAVRRKRRWFQFSLRTLLVFVVMIGFGSAWLGVKIQKAQRQKAAVEAILKSGAGGVIYDFQMDSQGNMIPNATPPGSKWLRSLVGVDFLQSVVGVVYYANHSLVAADFERLNDLSELKKLLLLGPRRIPEAVIKPLAGLTRLEALLLDETDLTDAETEYFKSLTHLTRLQIRSPRLTDAGLEFLTSLTKLKHLDLVGTQVTDAGIQRLLGLTQLEDLVFMMTGITDAGLKHIKGLSRLRMLDLGQTRVTGVGLANLKGLNQLISLGLEHTSVGDDAIPNLAALTGLQELNLDDTRISDAGMKSLRKALPKCDISPDVVVSMD